MNSPHPQARLKHSSSIEVSAIGRNQHYPIDVYDMPDGSTTVIVYGVDGNTSLINAAEGVHDAIAQDYPNATILECWPSKFDHGTPGLKGGYADPDGTGGSIGADLDELARQGLDLRV